MWPLELLLITGFALAGNPYLDDLSFFGARYQDIFPVKPKEFLLADASNHKGKKIPED